ncbi:M48 family metallopeptidase [Geminicoccus roseus]|uniref:M48 family metallopeptidase n=1 Tax=Geminicoccus roseus TaxID=404900 RepID=UPI00040CBED5|nr:M48 family metallopeptidase [Geminicoccus roseus]
MRFHCSRCASLSRRRMLGVAGLGGAFALSGCSAYNELAASTVTPAQEAELGAQAFQQIKSETPQLRDASAQERVQAIASRIIPASGSDIPYPEWEVVVFDSDEINAFALPGGHIGVYRGILELAESDDEVATVMGHEVGHVTARHAAQRIGTTQIAELGAGLVGVGAQAYGLPPQILGLLGAGVQYGVILPYTRNQELEADALGLHYMAEAAYNPQAAVSFWQSMAAAGGGSPPAFLSTHPSGDQRIDQIQEMLPEVMPVYREAAG